MTTPDKLPVSVDAARSTARMVTEIYVVTTGTCISIVEGAIDDAGWLQLAVEQGDLIVVVRDALQQEQSRLMTTRRRRKRSADRRLIVQDGDLGPPRESYSAGWHSVGDDGLVYEQCFERNVSRSHVERLTPCDNVVMSVFCEPEVYIAQATVFGSEHARERYLAFHGGAL